MKKPAPAENGGAGAKVEESHIHRPRNTSRSPRQISARADVPPNWRHVGSLVDNILARISVEST